jgi:hypothetical protein
MSAGLTPRALQVEQAGEVEAGDAVHIAPGQQGFADGRVHRLPLDRIHRQPVGLGKGRPGLAAGIEDRRSEGLAGQVGGFADAALLQGKDRRRGGVIDHVHRLDLGAGRLGVVLDQRIEVGKTHLVGAGGNAGHRPRRAVAGVDGHVQAFGCEVALALGQQEGCRGAFEAPVEGELQLDRLVREGRGGNQGATRAAASSRRRDALKGCDMADNSRK